MDHLPPVALLANPSKLATQSLAAAILVPRELRLNSLGGLGFPWKLCGYRLVGDSLLGWRGIECQRFVLSAVLDWLREHEADFLLVEYVDQRSTLASHLCANGEADFIPFPVMPQRPQSRVRFPTPPADLWRKFSKKALNSLRQKAKSIVRSRLVRVTEPDQVPNFIEHVDAVIHSSEPRRRRSSVASDCRELQMCLQLAERRWLRSYIWMIDGTPAGFVIRYQNRSGFRLRRLLCDNRHDRHSAETIMLFRVLEDLIKHDTPLAADFGPGDEPYKRLFANELVRTSDMLLVRRSRGLRACLAYVRACRGIRVMARTVMAALRDCNPRRLLLTDSSNGAALDADE